MPGLPLGPGACRIVGAASDRRRRTARHHEGCRAVFERVRRLRRGLRSRRVGGKRRLGGLDEGREGGGLVHGELGEDATVDLDAREGQALDEAVVREAVLARRRVDALDPEATEVALLLAAVVVGVDEGVGDLLLRLPVETRTLTAVSLGAL